VLRRAGEDAAGGFEPVELRHADVHQHDVGLQRADLVDRLASVGGLPDHLHRRLGVEDHAEPGAHERLVVDQQDADQTRPSTGSCARSTKPPPSRGPASSVPPYNATRSRMPTRPCPIPSLLGTPAPSSAISSSTDESIYLP